MENEKKGMDIKKYLKDGAYIISIILAALSNFFIDKTQEQRDHTIFEKRIEKMEAKVSEINMALIITRLDNLEKNLGKVETNLTQLNGRTDDIYKLLVNLSSTR